MTLRRLLPIILLFFALAVPLRPVFAADPAPQPAAVSVDELQKLVDTLQDDQSRAHLVDQLRALIAVQRGHPPPPAEPDVPDAVGLLHDFSSQINAISSEILAAVTVIVDAPRLLGWLQTQLFDPAGRERWIEIATNLGITFGAAFLAEWIVRLLLRRPRRALAARSGNHWAVRILLMLSRAVLDILPLLAFAICVYAILPTIHARRTTQRVAEIVASSVVTARVILAIARALLIGEGSGGFKLGMTDETRNYLYIWIRRFTAWAVYGYGLASAAWWLGVPGGIYALLLKGTALAVTVLAVIFILQNRQPVAARIRGFQLVPDGTDTPAETEAKGDPSGWQALRERIADVWHVLAIVYVVGVFGVYVLQVDGGFIFVLRATLISIFVLAIARLLSRLVLGISHRGFAIGDDLKERFPTLEARANRYLPALSVIVSIGIYCFALIALLQAWGVGAFAWFDSDFGRRVAGGLVSIGAVLLGALIVWELFSSLIERYLSGVDSHGRRITRSARARTLLPLLRTTMLIVIIVMVTLIVLAEVGVNIAPLLAGAGVVGLAIGFGSQALVKDVITGLFILIEDTLAVGDVVDVGGGHSGTVEALSIRSIRLRDMSGTVHSVPFSNVSYVNNMSRDFAYSVSDIAVQHAEDPDDAIAVLKEVSAGLAADPEWKSYIIGAPELIGVDKFTNEATIIRLRFKTIAMKQWAVGREFNRRIKKAFNEKGILMPAANQTAYLHNAAPETATSQAMLNDTLTAKPAP